MGQSSIDSNTMKAFCCVVLALIAQVRGNSYTGNLNYDLVDVQSHHNNEVFVRGPAVTAVVHTEPAVAHKVAVHDEQDRIQLAHGGVVHHEPVMAAVRHEPIMAAVHHEPVVATVHQKVAVSEPVVYAPVHHEVAVAQPVHYEADVHEAVFSEPAGFAPVQHKVAVHEPAVYAAVQHEVAVHEPAVYAAVQHKVAVHEPAVYAPAHHEVAVHEPAVYAPVQRKVAVHEPVVYAPVRHEAVVVETPVQHHEVAVPVMHKMAAPIEVVRLQYGENGPLASSGVYSQGIGRATRPLFRMQGGLSGKVGMKNMKH